MKVLACAPAFTSLLAGMLVICGMSDCGMRIWKGMEHRALGMEYEARRDQGSEGRWFKVLNIEQQNKKPQNDEVITSIFEIPCSILCGSKKS